MAESTGLPSLREAVEHAQVGTEGVLEFSERLKIAGSNVAKQLHVSYQSGNEYLRLDTLLAALQQAGTVKVFEYRGRGAGEQPRLVADVEVAGEIFQLIYHLV